MAKKKKKPDFSKPKEEPKKSLSVDLEAESSEIVENAASSDESEEISDTCVVCGKKADKMLYWGKAY